MPTVFAGDVHIDSPLTNISIAYRNPEYIADEIFPIVYSTKQSGIVPKFDQSHWFRDAAMLRAPGAKSQRGGFTVDTSDKFYADRFSFGFELPDEVRDNQDDIWNLEMTGSEFATDKVLLSRERKFASAFMATGVWGTDKVGAVDFTKWSDYGGSQPLVDITTFKDEVEAKIGREPNSMAMGKLVWSKLKWHPDLVDSIKYTQRGQVSRELFAALVELERVHIGRAIFTSSNPGTAEASVTYSRVWGDDALLYYAPARPSLLTPSAGYTFVWNRVANAPQYIKRMRNEEQEITIIEANTYFDHKQTSKNAGLYIDDAVD